MNKLILSSFAFLILTVFGLPLSKNDEIKVWISKIGPYRNPSETYAYYSLPFCRPTAQQTLVQKYADIGEVLQGREMIDSGIELKFLKNTAKQSLCKQTLTMSSTKAFRKAISKQYWYQLFVDDLPVWGLVGSADDGTIYTHKSLRLSHNQGRVIEVNLTSENPVEVVEGASLDFTYSVEWVSTRKLYENRFDRYLDYSFFEHQIHWFSIFNSFMMVLFLCGLVTLILLRTLKNDFVRYREVDTSDPSELYDRFEDESGWKQIAGDVFRPPKKLAIFCALYGAGIQLIICAVAVVLYAIAFKLYTSPDEILHAGVLMYCVSNFLSGYFSAKLYSDFSHKKKRSRWVNVLLLTWGVLPTFILTLVVGLNAIGFQQGANPLVPAKGLFFMVAVWIVVCFPLCFAGSLIARNYTAKSFKGFPVRVNVLPRQIPEQRWYTQQHVLALLTGWLPFASIFIECYFILSSFWNYKFYYVYGFMLLVLFILCAVVACVTIFAVYLLLSSEDYRWQWMSFFGGSSVGCYVFVYSVYYFFFKTNMTGIVQTAYYFGYMAIFCSTLSVICGSIGVVSSLAFVKRIYQNIHVD